MYKNEYPAESIARAMTTTFTSASANAPIDCNSTREADAMHALKKHLADELELRLRLAADFDNYKKRVAREIDQRASALKEALVHDLLPVIDNLERIVAAKDSAAESLHQGAEMILNQAKEALKKHGFDSHDDLGVEFDSKKHHALKTRRETGKPHHAVLEVWERRWSRGGELFRAAKVVVNNLETESEKSETCPGSA